MIFNSFVECKRSGCADIFRLDNNVAVTKSAWIVCEVTPFWTFPAFSPCPVPAHCPALSRKFMQISNFSSILSFIIDRFCHISQPFLQLIRPLSFAHSHRNEFDSQIIDRKQRRTLRLACHRWRHQHYEPKRTAATKFRHWLTAIFRSVSTMRLRASVEFMTSERASSVAL